MGTLIASKAVERREISPQGQGRAAESGAIINDLTLDKSLLEIAQARLGTAEVQAQIWHALVERHDIHEVLQRWVESLAGHINDAVIGIWLKTEGAPAAMLQASNSSGIADATELLWCAQADVDQVLLGTGARMIAELAIHPRWCEQQALLRRERATMLILHPLASEGAVTGVVAAILRGEVTNGKMHCFKIATEEMSVAFGCLRTDSVLRQANGTLRRLLHCSPLGLIGLSVSGRVTSWNLASEKLFGWTEQEVVGQALAIVSHEALPGFQEWFNCALRGQPTQSFEILGQRRDGTSIEVGLTLVPYCDIGNRIAGIVATVVDLTARKQSERRVALQHLIPRILAESRQPEQAASRLLEAACRHLGWTHGEFWTVNDVSRTARRTASWPAPTVMAAPHGGTPCEVPLSDASHLSGRVYGDRTSIWEPRSSTQRCASGAESTDDGNARDAVAFPIFLSNGRIIGILIFSAEQISEPDGDIKETMAAMTEQIAHFIERQQKESVLAAKEAALRQSEKMEAIGVLAGGVAHDFNNLLTVIIGHSEIGQECVVPGSSLANLLSEIELAGKRAAALTKQLLAFSRKQVIDPVMVNINDRVVEMERMLRRLIGENIELRTSLSPEVYPVKADPAQIEQILLNLVVNARDAMPGGGRIVIQTANTQIDRAPWAGAAEGVHGPFVVLSVSDTGCGMDEQTKSRIFEPFFTTKGKGSGTGFGLATIYGIARQAGGGVTVESQPNQGATFKVFLPRTRDALLPINVETALGPIPRGTETVLVVDDEESVRSVVCAILHVRGYKTLQAADGAAALRACRRRRDRPDLIITDMLMPGMSGQELAERVGDKYPAIKLLMMSSFAGDETRCDQPKAGMSAFLHKPFTSEVLARKVREILDR